MARKKGITKGLSALKRVAERRRKKRALAAERKKYEKIAQAHKKAVEKGDVELLPKGSQKWKKLTEDIGQKERELGKMKWHPPKGMNKGGVASKSKSRRSKPRGVGAAKRGYGKAMR